MDDIIKKILWKLKLFFGRKYIIKETEGLQDDEVLFFGRKIYIKKR